MLYVKIQASRDAFFNSFKDHSVDENQAMVTKRLATRIIPVLCFLAPSALV